jgi:chromosome segregation ATPase
MKASTTPRSRSDDLIQGASTMPPAPAKAASPIALHEVRLSPARRALADHLTVVATASVEVEKAERPVARLREQARVASQQLTAAEADLAAIDKRHSDSIRDAAQSGAEITLDKPPTAAVAEATIENARRTLNAVRGALLECEAAADTARKALRDVMAQSDQLVMAVMVEEHDAALVCLSQAYTAYETAVAEVAGIRGSIFERAQALQRRAPDEAHPWFACGNALQAKAAKTMLVSDANMRTVAARWAGAMVQLATDATARG